jgi:hypothetical protein
MDKQNSEQVPKKRRGKKPYAAPRLIEYGTIAKLTQGTLTVGTDSGPQGKNSQCL